MNLIMKEQKSLECLSTNLQSDEIVNIHNAILKGLAEDKSLYSFDFNTIQPIPFIKEASFVQVAEDVLKVFFKGSLFEKHISQICTETFNFPLKLEPSNDNGPHILELYHGPTAAFKDFGARFLSKYLAHAEEDLTIVTATSGDTGGSVGHAFHGIKNIKVIILFPDDGVSDLQRKQMTCLGDNIHAISVKGSFDDCQSLAKTVLNSLGKTAIKLTSANSINIGRLLPQVCYHFYTAHRNFEQHKIKPNFIIPSGNFGNAFAALIAKILGAPINNLTISTNSNMALHNYFSENEWHPQASIKTFANAMDVGSPSNMSRFFHLKQNYKDKSLFNNIKSIAVSDEQISQAIQTFHKKYNKIICPHTATAYYAYLQNPAENSVVVSTAHPAKFNNVILKTLGKEAELPLSLKSILNKEENFSTMENDPSQLEKLITDL